MSIKQIASNLAAAFNNTATAASELTLVSSEIVADSTGFIANNVKDFVPACKEVVLAVPTATAVVRSRNNGTTFEEEEAKLYASLPSSMSEGVKASVIASANTIMDLFESMEMEIEEVNAISKEIEGDAAIPSTQTKSVKKFAPKS